MKTYSLHYENCEYSLFHGTNSELHIRLKHTGEKIVGTEKGDYWLKKPAVAIIVEYVDGVRFRCMHADKYFHKHNRNLSGICKTDCEELVRKLNFGLVKFEELF